MTFSEYMLENTPISARPACPECSAQMYLSRIELKQPGFDLRHPSNVRGVSTSRPPWCNSNRTPSFGGRLKKPRRNPDGSALSPRQH